MMRFAVMSRADASRVFDDILAALSQGFNMMNLGEHEAILSQECRVLALQSARLPECGQS